MPNDPRYEIKNDEIQGLLLGTLGYMKEHLPKGWGATLMLFEFEGESFFYGSTAERESMIKALREFINREQ